MPATNVIPAKIALFARLKEETDTGRLLEGVTVNGQLQRIQVTYAWPGENDAGMLCIYGGYPRFNQVQALAERNVLVNETAYVSVFIRVTQRPAVDVEVTDVIASQIATKIVQVLVKNPRLTNELSWSSIAEGNSDYEQPPEMTISRMALQVGIESTFGYK